MGANAVGGDLRSDAGARQLVLGRHALLGGRLARRVEGREPQLHSIPFTKRPAFDMGATKGVEGVVLLGLLARLLLVAQVLELPLALCPLLRPQRLEPSSAALLIHCLRRNSSLLKGEPKLFLKPSESKCGFASFVPRNHTANSSNQ